MKKHQRWHLRHTLVKKLSKFSTLAEIGALQSCSQCKTTDNADEEVLNYFKGVPLRFVTL